MIGLPAGTRVWLAAGVTDMRKGMDGLAALVQTTLAENAFSGQLFALRGRRGDLVKLLWFDGDGMCVFAKLKRKVETSQLSLSYDALGKIARLTSAPCRTITSRCSLVGRARARSASASRWRN